MTILSVSKYLGTTGQVGQSPDILRVDCDNTFAQVITAGFLTPSAIQPFNLTEKDIVLVHYSTGIAWFSVDIDSVGVITLTDEETTIPANLVVSGSITSTTGNITSGSSGDAGTLISFPSTASSGTLIVAAVNNTGNTNTTISNAAMGQASVISIPDPGAATANFLLDTGTANILTDNQQFVGLTSIIATSAGTWTRTRIAEGNYVLRHTAGDDTTIMGIDITQAIRTTASKGLRLASIDVIYSIGTLALDAHTMTLDQISYANNVAVAVTSVPLTGSLSTATQANPYVTNITVTTPAFLVTADSKYVAELTINNSATSAYDFYGLNLRFSKTIG